MKLYSSTVSPRIYVLLLLLGVLLILPLPVLLVQSALSGTQYFILLGIGGTLAVYGFLCYVARTSR